jgi:geranylgeranyl reductase family protein
VTTPYDAIVVGAGPAGSTASRHLAEAGARVLVLDKARFPRDKPCGGGVTFRADAAAGIDLAPVTEREIYGVRVSAALGRRFDRTTTQLLARMTQRSRLDEYLLERAAEAGVDVRDGACVTQVEQGATSVIVRSNGDVYAARVLIGADGVNGPTARALGLAPALETAVAFEANLPLDERMAREWEHLIALDLGGIPGGYGWVFPKGDHLNIGVGGWHEVGPTLRARLSAYCRYYGFDESQLFGHRGYRLPLRRDDAPVVYGNAMLAGDAAALVDPLSGEGIWAAFVSGRLAAEQAQRYLAGDAPDLAGYQRALDAIMRDEIIASRRLAAILHRLPAVSVLVMKYSDTFWRYLVQIVRGELTYPELPKKLGPLQHALYWLADREIRARRRKLAA